MPHSLQVTVMLGGPSAEREVSLRSGRAVAKALRDLGHHVQELDPQGNNWDLPAATEVVFLALHGTYGEDGRVQERLEQLGVPYTGCGPEASRTAFDKVRTKECCVQAGLEVAPYLTFDHPETPWPEGWTPPVVVKPVRQGSSIGLGVVMRIEDWPAALATAFQYDGQVLVEAWIEGRETTVGILDDHPLPVAEVRPKDGILDYDNKYTPGATDYFCPANFDPPTTHHIQQAGLRAFQAVGGRDYARVDVMVRADGTPVVLEVNTLPGMTETSLLPKAADAAGIRYTELCQRMLELALRRASR